MSEKYEKLILLIICSALLVMPALAVSTGSIIGWGNDYNGKVSQKPTGNNFIAVAAGEDHSLALKSDGSIVSWGDNYWGQLTHTPSDTGNIAIAAGDLHSVALKSDGSIVTWGSDTQSQVWTTPKDNGYVAIAAGGAHSLALKSDGSIVSWGSNGHGEVSQTPTDTGYVAIAAGLYHCLALKSDGSIVSWGGNNAGQVTSTPTDTGYVAIAARDFHSHALKSDGSIVSWGDDGSGTGTGVVSKTPMDSGYVAIASGSRHGLALKSDSSIIGWGYNSDGTVLSQIPKDKGYFAIASGKSHCLALQNHPPVANNQDITTDENNAIGIALTATDFDGNTIAYTVATNPSHGTLTGTAPSLSYIPNQYYNGVDSFTFKANDGSFDSNIATVSITVNPVNDAPVADAQTVITNEDTAKRITLTATDVEGDYLTYSVVTPPAYGSLSGTAPDVTYTPALNFNGADSFTFKSNDGQLDSNTASITITVTPVNDAPVATTDSYSTNEDVALNVATAGVLTNDVDVDSTVITAVKVTNPAHGTLSLNAAGSFVYTPTANWNGIDTFTYKAYDGSLNSNVVTVLITVTPVNDAPVATTDSYTAIKNTVLTVPAKGVLINDVDIDSTLITAIKVTDPAHGKVVWKNDGSFTYTPMKGYVGTDSFTYKANDGLVDSNIATVSLTVKPSSKK